MLKLFSLFLFLLILFSISLVAAAQGEERNTRFHQNVVSARHSINISNVIKSNAKELITTVYLFPKEIENQRATVTTSPHSKIEDGKIVFEFDEKGTIAFKVMADVERRMVFEKVGRVNLSEARNPEGLDEYTKPSTYILSNDPFIRNKAQQLATQDTFETLYNLAEYVRNNLEYDTNFREPKNASWIMQEKRGVCSHYTILFMALARSLGIATRYVSGEAYSTLENKSGEHAWAEAWIPGHGWIPFDVNFGQYGWLDASHVVMMYSIDAGGTLISYQYLGEIEKESLKIEAEITDIGENFSLPLEIEIDPLLDTVSLDSYLPVQVKVKNPNNYYIALSVHVSIAPGVFGTNEKVILLKPKSEGAGYFISYIAPENSGECGTGCIATLEIRDIFGNSAITFVKFEKGATGISLVDAQRITAVYGREKEIDFYCKIGKEFYYDYEDMDIECVVSNDREAKTLSICHQELCENFTIGSNETKTIFLKLPVALDNAQNNKTIMKCLTLCVTARERRSVLAMSCLDTTILESPNITIVETQNAVADYGSQGNFEIIINSNTITSAEMIIETGAYVARQNISIEKGQNTIRLPIKTWKLKTGDNQIHVVIKYMDKRGREYLARKEIIFTVRDVSIFRRIIIAITRLFE
ncbi:MAG: transglutaminase-like domain-containing protein [Candidatus Pacearchaeota archaeon]|nr:transglutaminase-like domain-containing protein [Candidatus Pacearchaeota archaeon]